MAAWVDRCGVAPPSPVDQWNPGVEKGRDDGDFATAYFHYSAKLLGRTARILGDAAAAQRYEVLAENIRSAWWTEYGNEDGSLRRPTQANYVRALAFGLAPDEKREKVAQQLVDLIRASDTHVVGTGAFGTALLLPVLADTEHVDLAYDLPFQNTPPSWMTMIDRGATTIWEMWDGVDENGKAHFSLNHFSLGSVISFMHTHIAGIRPGRDSPAYRPLSYSTRSRRRAHLGKGPSGVALRADRQGPGDGSSIPVSMATANTRK
jgi:alpha-L-rhamnosidase